MKIIKANFDTNFVDGDGSRTAVFLFNDNETDSYIESIIQEYASEYFADHEYLAAGYDGFDNEEQEEWYYENCSWDKEEITEEDKCELLEDEPDTEVYDYTK